MTNRRPWSITTTVRNPARIPSFLQVLFEFEGKQWNEDLQMEYQAALIQYRVYGAGNSQFLNRLSPEDRNLVENEEQPIGRDDALRIFHSLSYEDPPMRGRQSFNVLKKFGLATISENKTVRLTKLGHELLEYPDNFSDIMLRCLLKWQLPQPNERFHKGANIIPFVGTLKLIEEVNKVEEQQGRKAKGISIQEFQTFVPTLLHDSDISRYADTIIRIREKQQNKTPMQQAELWMAERQKFLQEFLGPNHTKKNLEKLEKDLRDYGDNAIRYFRMTGLIWLRGDGRYVDLSPYRTTEVEGILASLPSQARPFKNLEEYLHYMADSQAPRLPWESVEGYRALIKEYSDITSPLGSQTQPGPDIEGFASTDLSKWRAVAKEMRQATVAVKALRDAEHAQTMEGMSLCIERLKNIKDEPSPPIALEYLCTMALHALNDAIEIKGNYPKGEDNQPTGNAPGGKPDIECLYPSFVAICEVTMLRGTTQHYAEGQPVLRHLRKFKNAQDNSNCYGLFIAPAIHEDTFNVFKGAIKKVYDGTSYSVIPLTIDQLVRILENLRNLKEHRPQEKLLSHTDIEHLFHQISEAGGQASTSAEWQQHIDRIINEWIREVLS